MAILIATFVLLLLPNPISASLFASTMGLLSPGEAYTVKQQAVFNSQFKPALPCVWHYDEWFPYNSDLGNDHLSQHPLSLDFAPIAHPEGIRSISAMPGLFKSYARPSNAVFPYAVNVSVQPSSTPASGMMYDYEYASFFPVAEDGTFLPPVVTTGMLCYSQNHRLPIVAVVNNYAWHANVSELLYENSCLDNEEFDLLEKCYGMYTSSNIYGRLFWLRSTIDIVFLDFLTRFGNDVMSLPISIHAYPPWVLAASRFYLQPEYHAELGNFVYKHKHDYDFETLTDTYVRGRASAFCHGYPLICPTPSVFGKSAVNPPLVYNTELFGYAMLNIVNRHSMYSDKPFSVPDVWWSDPYAALSLKHQYSLRPAFLYAHYCFGLYVDEQISSELIVYPRLASTGATDFTCHPCESDGTTHTCAARYQETGVLVNLKMTFAPLLALPINDLMSEFIEGVKVSISDARSIYRDKSVTPKLLVAPRTGSALSTNCHSGVPCAEVYDRRVFPFNSLSPQPDYVMPLREDLCVYIRGGTVIAFGTYLALGQRGFVATFLDAASRDWICYRDKTLFWHHETVDDVRHLRSRKCPIIVPDENSFPAGQYAVNIGVKLDACRYSIPARHLDVVPGSSPIQGSRFLFYRGSNYATNVAELICNCNV